MKTLKLIPVLLFTAAFFAAASAYAEEREYNAHVPKSYDAKKPAPLVLALHGYTTDMDTMEEMSGLSDLSDKEGFIVVYPNGLKGTDKRRGWNAEGAYYGRLFKKSKDEAYLLSLVADLKKEYSIDPRRVYAVGYDNGGFMANILADRHPDVFAAIGVVGATAVAGVELKNPVSVIHVHGMNDPVCLIGGNDKFEAMDELMAKINKLNGGGRETTVMKTDAVTGSLWKGKTHDAASYVVEDLGHEWPAEGIDAAKVIWDFFKTHPMK